MKNTVAVMMLVALLAAGCTEEQKSAPVTMSGTTGSNKVIETRIGTLEFTREFENGYPTPETVEKLYDEMDFQRASQLYVWGLPLVSSARWLEIDKKEYGANLGDLVIRKTYSHRRGMLTINDDTYYAFVTFDMNEKGAMVIEIPEGIDAIGSIQTTWQIELGQMTEPGTYLILPPNAEEPEDADRYSAIHKSKTNGIIFGLRIFAETDEQKAATAEQILVYPHSERNKKPAKTRLVYPTTSPAQAPPRGMRYWELLSEAINREPVAERDRFMMAMLKPLGIEKGKPFNPSERQIKILTEGALVGEAFAKAIQADSKLEQAIYVEGSNWEFAATSDVDQRKEHYDQLDGRAGWFYEAITNTDSMHPTGPSRSQIFLGAYRDSDGNPLLFDKNYVLRVPADVPVSLFWSVTVYDINTRSLLNNETQRSSVGSIRGLKKNDDGTTDIYIGREKPEGTPESNWIQTMDGVDFFVYFRLYGATIPYFDKSWVLPDIELISHEDQIR